MTDVVQGKIADFVINAAQHISRHYGAKRLPAQDAAE
jgi:hypothetical protein